MQSEEPAIIQSLEDHLAEYGHTTVGQDISAAILVIRDLHQKAALSAAEPVAWLVKRYDLEGILLDTELSFVRPTIKSTCRTDMEPLYAAPPAPSVAVKALEWKAHNEGFGHGRMYYGTGVFGHWYGVSRVKKGCWGCVHHIDGKAVHLPMKESLEGAKAAAQADYEARIRSALSAQVQDVAGWQLVPKQPTEEMLDAYWGQTGESEAMRSRVHARAKIHYHVMLAAAPAKQEGGTNE